MSRVVIVVREIGRLKPDYSLDFDLPEIPKPGSYNSIYRGTPPETHSEDMVVEQVWWELNHPETRGFGRTPPLIGKPLKILVECTPAIGPSSSDRWRDMLESHRSRGAKVPEFKVERFSVRQYALSAAGIKDEP